MKEPTRKAKSTDVEREALRAKISHLLHTKDGGEDEDVNMVIGGEGGVGLRRPWMVSIQVVTLVT